MIVMERVKEILLSLAQYYLLTRRLVQQLLFPEDRGGRATRRRLERLQKDGLIRRHNMLVASRFDPTPAPVYLLSDHGRLYLAHELHDNRFLRKPTKLPHPNHLFHHLALAETHIALDQAVASQAAVTVARWINEFDVINDEEPDAKKHFRLFTVVQDKPRVTCSPDAAFMLSHDDRQMIFYVELERGGTGAKQLVRRKAPGYRRLAEQQLNKRHFPETSADGFRVILLAPTPDRRDTFRRTFREAVPIEYRTDLWRFASISELTPETFLDGDVFYECDDQPPSPLVQM
jgi:hypothetical protein